MMTRCCIIFCCCCIYAHTYAQPAAVRPKIGLALSGGAAKGLAHIGILKAIDSAGLKIDYITGTSMGSIIGGLYAIGYSADSIEQLALKTDWDLMLTNQSPLRSMMMEEKEEYSKYALELPWANNMFRLPSGVLEGQELWLKLAELFAPVANIKDFADFNIPFRCISTDIGSGEAVVIGSGEIVSAIRSSIAMPSLFTAIDHNGRKLVDGGIVRNFPVRDVKEMGAGFIIGSNVAAELYPSKKALNALQILLQVAFFREAEDRKNEVPLCDIYIPLNLEKYTMGSFNQSANIIRVGLEEGRKLYPRFKKVADSLDAIYGKQPMVRQRLPLQQRTTLSGYEIKGLQHTTTFFFLHSLNLQVNRSYTPEELSHMVRNAFGTRYYNRIVYSLEPQPDGTRKIIFDVTENPLTFSKLSLHYNEFSGISVIANLTSRNFIIPNSRDLVTVNVGENMQLRAEHLQYTGRLKKLAFILGAQVERLSLTTYRQYKQDGMYKQHYYHFNGRMQFSTSRALTVGIGSRYERFLYYPSITGSTELKGKNNFFTHFAFLTYNSLNRNTYPRKGIRIHAEAGRITGQHPDIDYTVNGQPVENTDSAFTFGRYNRVMLNAECNVPISSRSVFTMHLQSGVNFVKEQSIMNDFFIGGITPLFRNQISFAGLKEGSFRSPEVAAFQLGLRYELFNNTYVIASANALANNFLKRRPVYQTPDYFTGYALSFAYNFALGPLELSVMYSDQSRKVNTYVNIGIPF